MTVTATKGSAVPDTPTTVEEFERALDALGVPMSAYSIERDELLTGLREVRYAERKQQYEGDPTIDPRRRELYLDRELWDTRRCARELDVTPHRISELRGGRKTAGGQPIIRPKGPHPSVFPAPDGPAQSWLIDVPSYSFEAGRVREWAEKRGHHVLNLETGSLERVRVRHGRPRHDRTLMSRVQQPGAPRRGKKTKDTGQ